MKPLIVQKYGGTSVATPEQIRGVAQRIASLRESGFRILIVVSAMGRTTDELVELAYRVSPTPNRRELDMLLTTGERVSMALISMALNDRGCPAISLTGSQAGLLTDEQHSNARILDIRPTRVESELTRNSVVVLAGFQGVSPRTKDVTTLGRGGSDTSAVAMAAHFRAERCEILKDVEGVRSGDPALILNTEFIEHLHFFQLLDMTFWGAKVLHYRSVELAHLLNIALSVGLAAGEGRRTKIDGEGKMYEQARIISVNSHREVRTLLIKKSEFSAACQELGALLRENSLAFPQMLDSEKRNDEWAFLVTAANENLNAIAQLTSKSQNLRVEDEHLSSVTATCQGSFASALPQEIAGALQSRHVTIHKMLFAAMSITVIVAAKEREKTLQILHDIRLPQPIGPAGQNDNFSTTS